MIIRALRSHGVVKFGDFILKNGEKSAFYIDLRESLGHPRLFRMLSHQASDLVKTLNFSSVCGVPYAAIPLATAIAMTLETSLIMCRKTIKDHGQKKMIEGVFSRGQRCLLVEDVVTSGGSILETAAILREAGLQVHDCVSVICREPAAVQKLSSNGIHLHYLLTLEQLLHETT